MQGYVIRIGSSANKNNFYDVVIQEKTTLDQIAIIAATILNDELDDGYEIAAMDSVFSRHLEKVGDLDKTIPWVDSREVNVASIFDPLVEYMNIKNRDSDIFVYFVNITDKAKKYPEIINSNDREYVSKNQKLVSLEVGAGKLDSKYVKQVNQVLTQVNEGLKERDFYHFTVIRIDDVFYVINNIRTLNIQIYFNEHDYVLGHENCFPEQTLSLYKHCYYVSLLKEGFGGVKFNFGLGDSNLTNYDVSLIDFYLTKLLEMINDQDTQIQSKKPKGYYQYDKEMKLLKYQPVMKLEDLIGQRIRLSRPENRFNFARNRNVPQISIDLAYGIESENIIMAISNPINTIIPVKGYSFDSLVANIIKVMQHYSTIGYNFITVKTDDFNLYTIIRCAQDILNTDIVYDKGDSSVEKVMRKKDDSEGSYYFNHYRKYEEFLDPEFKDFLEYSHSYKTANYLMSGKDKSGAVYEMEKFIKKYK